MPHCWVNFLVGEYTAVLKGLLQLPVLVTGMVLCLEFRRADANLRGDMNFSKDLSTSGPTTPNTCQTNRGYTIERNGLPQEHVFVS